MISLVLTTKHKHKITNPMANKLGQFAVVMHSSCIILSLVYILYLFFFHFSIPFRHTYMSFISGNKAHRKKRRQRENIKMHIHSWVYKMKKTIATTFLVHTAHRITNKRALLLSLMIYVHSSVVTVVRSSRGLMGRRRRWGGEIGTFYA